MRTVDYSEPDQLTLEQEIALNQAIWRTVKGNAPYPGPFADSARRLSISSTWQPHVGGRDGSSETRSIG